MTQRTFLRNDGWFQPVTAGDVGVSTTTTTGFLSYFFTPLSSDVAMATTGTTFDGPSVAQGTTGIWLCLAGYSINTTNAVFAGLKVWDGTSVVASQDCFLPAGSTGAGHMSGIITNPAGNIKMSCLVNTPATGVTWKAQTQPTLGVVAPATTLTVIRIG